MNMFNEVPGRQQQKEATAEAVLEAARAEFEAVGFQRANLRAIAKRAGVSAGTVLHHFGDKSGLLHAALFQDLDQVLSDVLDNLGPGPLEKQLGRIAHAAFNYYARRPLLSRTLIKESLFAEGEWAERFRSQTAGVHSAIVACVERAQARGEVVDTLDPAIFAVAWLSYFYFALISWVQGAFPSPADLVRKLVKQHLDGLRPASQVPASKKQTRRKR